MCYFFVIIIYFEREAAYYKLKHCLCRFLSRHTGNWKKTTTNIGMMIQVPVLCTLLTLEIEDYCQMLTSLVCFRYTMSKSSAVIFILLFALLFKLEKWVGNHQFYFFYFKHVGEQLLSVGYWKFQFSTLMLSRLRLYCLFVYQIAAHFGCTNNSFYSKQVDM